MVEFSDFLNPILRSLFFQKYITLNYTFIIFVSYFIFYSGSLILVVKSVLAYYLSNICLFPLNVCLLLLNVLFLSVCHHNLLKKFTILSKPCLARCWEFGGACHQYILGMHSMRHAEFSRMTGRDFILKSAFSKSPLYDSNLMLDPECLGEGCVFSPVWQWTFPSVWLVLCSLIVIYYLCFNK